MNLKQLRHKKKMTQAELARLADLSQSTISEIENGTHDTTIEVLCKLCKSLEVTPNELLEGRY